jgi:uncharacterized protein YceH (UPF0502 family)
MDLILDDVELRVLGALIEKELATPEYYPLSMNALINACNQKTNREPVVSYDEKTVARAILGLREKQLVYTPGGSLVSKYGHNFEKHLNLVKHEVAILCVLMLRGPQTVGELRTRSERLHKFGDLTQVEQTLQGLDNAGMVFKLPRMPGQKESRYAHLLAGKPDIKETAPESSPVEREVMAENQRIKRLEDDVEAIKNELAELKAEIRDFKAQFE